MILRFTPIFLIFYLSLVLYSVPTVQAASASSTGTVPVITPDYIGIEIPPNIAPLNFKILDPNGDAQIVIRSTQGKPISLSSRKGIVQIPQQPWHDLLNANVGQPLYLDFDFKATSARPAMKWTATNHIAAEEVDRYLVYRYLKPLYNYYYNVGVYERDLSSFSVRPVLKNESFDRGCLNCHTFLNHSGDRMALNIRSDAHGFPALLTDKEKVLNIARTLGYLSWHPSGKYLAFSMNKLKIFFHTVGESRDVYDGESNIGVYDIDANALLFPPQINAADQLETWPSWGPEGRCLYFCSTPLQPIEKYASMKYDLKRVEFNETNKTWGKVETLFDGVANDKSAAIPRVSPDGRFLVFTTSQYGNFPIYRRTADLYLMDLSTMEIRKMELNSPWTESWHCWSWNSRWMVFSSKRNTGLFARPWFSHIDSSGHASKPFILPQENPAFYDSCIYNYNVPELIRTPVQASASALTEAILHPAEKIKPSVPAQGAFSTNQPGVSNPQ